MKLSIAMCTYNGAAYLPEQLESIAAQTRPPNELVVCDDASSDRRTLEIVKAFARDASFRVRLFVNQRNLGSKQNFAQAIRRCRGEIIFLCDQDDVWNKDKLFRIEHVFRSAPDVGLVFTDAEVVDENLKAIAPSLWQWEDHGGELNELLKQSQVFQALLRRNFVTGATVAFRSNLKRFVLPIPDNISLQHDGWIALVAAAVGRVTFLNEPLIRYRQHPGQQIGLVIKGGRHERRNSPLQNSLQRLPYPAEEIHAAKTVYARLITKCSRLVKTEDLEEIKRWIGRLETERTVLKNEAAPATERKDWTEVKDSLNLQTIHIEPYIRADVSRLRYRLRLRDIQAAREEIREDRLHGLQWADQTSPD